MLRATAPGLVISAALARSPAAAAPSETASLRYEAPPSCPDRDAFVSRVDARGGALTLADDAADTERVFVVRIDEQEGRFSGEVAIIADGRQTHRVVETEDCAELVDALALITVLAVDPVGAVAAPAAVVEPAVVTQVPEPRPGRWFAIGVGVAGAVGVAPGGLPTFPILAELDDRELGRLRVGARWGRGTSEAGDGAATFDWARIQVDGCPARATLELHGVGLGACAGTQIGALRGRGTQIAGARTASRPWVAPTLGGYLRRPVSERWFAELDAGVAFPLVRDRFYFAPDTTIHRVPGVLVEAAIMLGVSFP